MHPHSTWPFVWQYWCPPGAIRTQWSIVRVNKLVLNFPCSPRPLIADQSSYSHAWLFSNSTRPKFFSWWQLGAIHISCKWVPWTAENLINKTVSHRVGRGKSQRRIHAEYFISIYRHPNTPPHPHSRYKVSPPALLPVFPYPRFLSLSFTRSSLHSNRSTLQSNMPPQPFKMDEV